MSFELLLNHWLSSLLVCAHDLGRLIFRQSRLQELLERPTLLLDEVSHQKPIARVAAIFHPHRDIDRIVSKRVVQLIERLPLLYADIVRQSLPYPLRHVEAVETDMFRRDDMSELV